MILESGIAAAKNTSQVSLILVMYVILRETNEYFFSSKMFGVQ
jgi:hypothetical protein